MQWLVINADDFGMTGRINAAVLRAHTEGVLTSTSLMVTEPAWREAVELARRTPSLGVGLHLTVTADHALSPSAQIPHLVRSDGRFDADPVRNGLRYTFSKAARTELRIEMEAQFERFAATGLPWSHVDGHQHFHMHPALWENLLDLCDRYGVHRLRIPIEELRPHLRSGGDGPNLQILAGLILRAFARVNQRRLLARGTLGGKPPFFCDRLYGTFQSSNVHAAYLKALLGRLGGVTNEVHLHPGADYARSLPSDRQREDVRDVEMDALLDPEVRDRIRSLGLRTGSYAGVEAEARSLEPVILRT